MFKKLINKTIEEIDFHDGEILAFHLEIGNAKVTFKNWKEEIYELQFEEVVFFEGYEIGSDTNETKILNTSAEMNKAIKQIEYFGGSSKGYKNYNFKQINFSDGYGEPYLKIIFLSYKITRTT